MSLPLVKEWIMAKKRMIRTEEVEPSSAAGSSHDDDSERTEDSSWGVWSRKTYAKYWYVLGCIFVDIIAVLEVARIGPAEYSSSFSIALFIGLLIAQSYIYTKVWTRPAKQ